MTPLQMSLVMCAVDRSAEAIQLLSSSFGAKQHRPGMFAALCQELTQAVSSNRLGEGVLAWLRGAATDELEGFLDDCSSDPPPVQVRSCETLKLVQFCSSVACQSMHSPAARLGELVFAA